ncbi:hypothetical protein HDU83_005444, partial [Entophlyctis luteolus]
MLYGFLALIVSTVSIAALPINTAKCAGFVESRGGNFVVNGSEKHFSGGNSYQLGYNGNDLITEEFNMLANHSNFDLIRTWGFCETST